LVNVGVSIVLRILCKASIIIFTHCFFVCHCNSYNVHMQLKPASLHLCCLLIVQKELCEVSGTVLNFNQWPF